MNFEISPYKICTVYTLVITLRFKLIRTEQINQSRKRYKLIYIVV